MELHNAISVIAKNKKQGIAQYNKQVFERLFLKNK